MRLRPLIAITAVLLAAIEGCGIPAPAPDLTREEAAIRASDGRWLAAAQTRGFELALTAAHVQP